MELMFVVSTAESAQLLKPLLESSRRRGIRWGAFFTGEGADVLRDPGVTNLLREADRAVVCEHSWSRCGADGDAPIELGSQTDHSAMIADAGKIISL